MNKRPFSLLHRARAANGPLLLAVLMLACTSTLAQEDRPIPAAPCGSDEHRQFDFWVGEWDVTQNGTPAGVNRIERIDGGCALLERWISAQGNFTGSSLNFYDRRSERWRQLWLDTSGTVLELEGQLEPGPEISEGANVMVMVLEGEAPGPDGTLRANRITWTPQQNGTVRQHWEVQGEDSWTTAFDGIYQRREGTAPIKP